MARPSGEKTRCSGKWTDQKRGKPYRCSTFGYVMVNIKGVPHRQHRLLWEDTYGPIPEGYHIDHINGVKHDNRLENLRLATNQQNSSNREVGDYTNIDVRNGRYRVKICYYGKTYCFGTYGDLELAQLVRDEARVKLNGEFHGRR